MTFRRLCLLVEAAIHLAGARAALGLLPYRHFERLLQLRVPPPGEDPVTARAVGSAVQRIAGIVPWRSDCLIQAAAARWMLRRRGIVTSLHIGVAPHRNRPLDAHAWLVHRSIVLTGRAGHTRFRTIRTY